MWIEWRKEKKNLQKWTVNITKLNNVKDKKWIRAKAQRCVLRVSKCVCFGFGKYSSHYVSLMYLCGWWLQRISLETASAYCAMVAVAPDGTNKLLLCTSTPMCTQIHNGCVNALKVKRSKKIVHSFCWLHHDNCSVCECVFVCFWICSLCLAFCYWCHRQVCQVFYS